MNELAKPDIIFIVVDTLRADCYGYSQAHNINRLGKEGTTFLDAFSCTNTTDASITSIFSGKYTINHGIGAYGRLENREKLANITFLPEILKSCGYHTVALDWLGKWHKRGYDNYISIRHSSKRFYVINYLNKLVRFFHSKLPALTIWNKLYKLRSHLDIPLYPPADVVTDYALKIIREPHKPFFLYIHYFDPHTPYNPPSKYINEYSYSGDLPVEYILNKIRNSRWEGYLRSWINSDESVGDVISRYRGEVAFVDEEIGRLVDTLKDRGSFDDTIFVLTADHGESLTEHGIYFDHHGLYDTNIRVPLILTYQKFFPRGKMIKGLVQHTDIVPTLLKVLNVNSQMTFDGENLLPLIEGERKLIHQLIFVEEALYQRKSGVRTEKYKYIQASSLEEAMCTSCGTIHGGGLEELYDLVNDPEENQNLADHEIEVKNKLKEQLLKWTPTSKDRREKDFAKQVYDLDEEAEIKERLRRLGYF